MLLQKDMLSRARAEFDGSIKQITSWDDFVPALDEKKMVLAPWCVHTFLIAWQKYMTQCSSAQTSTLVFD